MTIVKENKGVIIFYIVVVVCTLMIISRTNQLNKIEESKNKEFVVNSNLK